MTETGQMRNVAPYPEALAGDSLGRWTQRLMDNLGSDLMAPVELVCPQVVEIPDADHVLVLQLREPLSALEEHAIARNFRLLEPDRVNAILLHHRVELAVIPRSALQTLRLVASLPEEVTNVPG